MARRGQFDAAVECYRQAVRFSEGQDPVALDLLAAAYAELGRFPEAVATAHQALAVASAAGNTALVEVIRTRLRFYEAGSPYREQ